MEENLNIEQEQVRNSAEYIAELEEIVHNDRQLKKIVGHEMRNRLNAIQGFPYLLTQKIKLIPDNEPLSPDKKLEIIELSEDIQRNVKQLLSISTVLALSSIKYKDLKTASEQFNLEEAVRDNLSSLEKEFRKNNLGILYEYNKKDEEPIYIYAHEGFMNAVINTILFNVIKHAPEYSLSRLGLSIQNKSLELICENLIGKSRQEYGLNTGVGLYLLDLARRQMKGELKIEINKANRKYHLSELVGYKNVGELENHDVFSLRFYIPMKELTFQPPKKQ